MKTRLDQLLVERGLAESRERAQRLIRAGLVVVDDNRIDKPGRMVEGEARLRLKGEVCPYVSRGGLKLAAALERFGLADLSGLRALDIGASTGGFSDCLLQHGAARVWAVDTGRGQLHQTLARDPRLVAREEANARYLEPSWVDGERIDLIGIDVSFISLRLILPPVKEVLAPEGSVVALVKPQFEAGRGEVSRGGVVRDRAVVARVLAGLIDFAAGLGLPARAICPSPLRGPAGNREFFLHLRRPGVSPAAPPDQNDIEQALDEAYNSSRGRE